MNLVKTLSGCVFSMVMKRVEKGKEAANDPSSQKACNDMATWPENKLKLKLSNINIFLYKCFCLIS